MASRSHFAVAKAAALLRRAKMWEKQRKHFWTKQMTSGSIWNPSGRRSGRWPGVKCCGSAAALAVNVSQVEVLSTSLRWATADHALEHRQIICWMRLEWELYFHSNNKTFEIKCGVLRFILNLHPNKRSIWRANLCIVFMFQKHVLSIQSVM